MDRFKEVLADLFSWTALAWLLTHLILIAIYGKVIIYEGEEWILWIEIVYTGLALILQTSRTIKDFKMR